jgi:anti-anti-sigma factor
MEMPLENWSDRVVVARLADDPQLSEDLIALDHQADGGHHDIVLDLGGVNYINSSHLARLLKLRKQMIEHDGRLIICSTPKRVWGAFLVTGLDNIFEFSEDVATALATVQIAR